MSAAKINEMDWMPQAIRDGIIVVLVISGPLVFAAAFIGLIVGILQAATQVQEQTIGSALKIIGVFALIIFAGFWMYQYLNQYTSKTLTSAFTFVTRQTQKAVPKNAFDEEGKNEASSENFQNSFNAANQPLELIKPEKLEEKIPQAGLPPGYLGSPEIPKPPVTKTIPPPEIPKLLKQVVKPQLPLIENEEPKPLQMPPNENTQQKINNENLNIENENSQSWLE